MDQGDHTSTPNDLTYEPDGDPSIDQEIRQAIYEFEAIVRSEKEMSSEAIMVGHMRDYALAQVLMSILNGAPKQDILDWLHRAAQSFRTYRRQTSTNPIRTYHREPIGNLPFGPPTHHGSKG